MGHILNDFRLDVFRQRVLRNVSLLYWNSAKRYFAVSILVIFYFSTVGFDEAKLFSQVEIKKSVTTYFSPCIDEDNKKTITKSEQK